MILRCMSRIGLGLIPGFLILLAACGMGGSGTTYPMTKSEVYKVLLDTEPPLFVFGGNALGGKGLPLGNDAIRWTLRDAGTQSAAIDLIAQVEEAGEKQSRVTITVAPAEGSRKERIAANMAENPQAVALYRAAMEEQIDAVLEKRDFAFSAIQDELASATVAAIPKINASVDEAARASRERDRQNIERAYRTEAQGGYAESSHSRTEPAFGEPMDRGVGSY